MRDRFEVSEVELRDRGDAEITCLKDSISRAHRDSWNEDKGSGLDDGTGVGCLREMENIFLREDTRLVLVVNEDRTRIDGSGSGAICHITAPWQAWPAPLICSQ